MGLLSFSLLTSCGVGDPYARDDPDLDRYEVTRKGTVLVDREVRRRLLQGASPAVREQLCGPAPPAWASLKAIRQVRPPREAGDDPTAEPFAMQLMRAGAQSLASDDPASVDAAVDLLDRWARGEGLTKFDRNASAEVYALNRTLLPVIGTWAIVRDSMAVDDERRERIHEWLKDLVERRKSPGGGDPDRVTSSNNHLYLHASVDMAWGVLVKSDKRYRRGIMAYRRALEDMREDGSLPLETMRGGRALWYQRHAIASLVAIAEMAALQGQDLYGLDIEGSTIHDAVRFLLDGIADPKIVFPYAETDFNSGTERSWNDQDLSFLVRRGHERHYMAWAEAYMARFPERDEAKRLHAVLAQAMPEGFRPMLDDYSGGDTSCFYADPETKTAP